MPQRGQLLGTEGGVGRGGALSHSQWRKRDLLSPASQTSWTIADHKKQPPLQWQPQTKRVKSDLPEDGSTCCSPPLVKGHLSGVSNAPKLTLEPQHLIQLSTQGSGILRPSPRPRPRHKSLIRMRRGSRAKTNKIFVGFFFFALFPLSAALEKGTQRPNEKYIKLTIKKPWKKSETQTSKHTLDTL